jgi:hypothetical protein
VQACRKLIDKANQAGGPDNITVIISRFDGEGLNTEALEGDEVGHRVFATSDLNQTTAPVQVGGRLNEVTAPIRASSRSAFDEAIAANAPPVIDQSEVVRDADAEEGAAGAHTRHTRLHSVGGARACHCRFESSAARSPGKSSTLTRR